MISGVAGGEHGANGFVAAHDQATGKEVWRFWTVPKPGRARIGDLEGQRTSQHGGAADLVHRQLRSRARSRLLAGRQSQPGIQRRRSPGRQPLRELASWRSIAKTGTLKWHYQFTPHDLWDWDATQTSVLVDADWQGRPRKLLLHASRNGFFYVFDRADGTLLLAKPFVRNLTWASGIGADGRPIRLPEPGAHRRRHQGVPVAGRRDQLVLAVVQPGAPGSTTCRRSRSAASIRRPTAATWEAGKPYLGGSQQHRDRIRCRSACSRRSTSAPARSAGSCRSRARRNSWGGTLATATGLVIFGEEGGALMAADAVTGKPLWSFPTNQGWRASPMTYMFDGKQYIAVASGSAILAFGLSGGDSRLDQPAAFGLLQVSSLS